MPFKNPEVKRRKASEYHKRWLAKNPGYRAAYRKKNSERMKERERAWRKANRDKCSAAVRRWRLKNSTKFYRGVADRKRFGGLRETVIRRDGGKCVDCEMTDQEHRLKYRCSITVDHVDGDESNNTFRNLRTRCLPCHGRKDSLRRWAKRSKETK